MGKISIKKSELDKIIKEETLKFKKAIALKGELKKIQNELDQLNECDVNEVQAGEVVKSKGLPYEGGQHKPKFATKNGNPHLKMEDSEEEITDTDADIDDVDTDSDSDSISKADVLKAIDDLKMSLGIHGGEMAPVGDDEAGEESSEEGSEEGSEEDSEGGNSEEGSEEGDEIFEFEEEGKMENAPAAPAMEEVKEEGAIQEDLEEPIEGKSVVQNADEDTVNDNMKKDTHVKAGGNLMEAEKLRMAQLAGIIKG
jgi:hypothetical protein